MPQHKLESGILPQFAQWVKIWTELPDYVQIRKPLRLFEAVNDGYSLQTVYDYARKHLQGEDEDLNFLVKMYSFCLVLIETVNGQIFGAFVTAYPLNTSLSARLDFVGTIESFVFMFTNQDTSL